MQMFEPLAWIFLASAVVMTLTWLVQRRSNNAGFVDVAWAACLGSAALYLGLVAEGHALPRLLVALMGAVWGFRLSYHLLARVLSEPEDGRYQALREHWSGHQGKFFGFFMLQAAAVALFALPMLIAASNPSPPHALWVVGAVAIWTMSQVGEALADHQLARWRSEPENRGRTCRAGLWAYSRHPNYFFEWLHWLAYFCLSVGSAYGWLSLSGPVLMWVSLHWITGIPFVEAQALRSRGEDYRSYQREVSAFFPWFPARAGNGTARGEQR